MRNPVLGLEAKIFLQTCGDHLVKNITKDDTIIFYNRYADNILLIHDNTKMTPEHISSRINKLH
jgi:hypothetical protein